MITASSSVFAWILVLITSVASVFGSLVIYVDLIWNAISKRHFSILHSNVFLGISLSLSCGTLLVTSLNALLPKSVTYILEGRPEYSLKQANQWIVPCVFCGTILCLVLNFIVLKLATNEVASCPHDLNIFTSQYRRIVNNNNEQRPLLEETHNSSSSYVGNRSDPEHNGATGEQHSTSTRTIIPTTSVASPKLLALSLQTTLGICVHRLPEGLMLFATSKTDSELGLSLMLALSIHSFSEGFAVAAPLYGAIQNRLKVVIFTIWLVCGPQILGAYIGSKIFTANHLPKESLFHFGLLMALTSGFILVVCIQMIASAFKYVSHDAVLFGVMAGVLLSLTSRAI